MKTVFAIGASAGGVDALKTILPAFESGDISVMVVMHLPPQGPNLIPSLFEDSCHFKIREPDPGEPLESKTIYIAPPDYHLCAELNGTVSLNSEDVVKFSRPSIDVMMESVAMAYRENAIGILLTGSNDDGAAGLKKIMEKNGTTIIQDPKTAEYATMPASAQALFNPTFVMNLDEMIQYISTFKDNDE